MTLPLLARGAIALDRLTVGHRGVAAVMDIDGCFEAGSMTAIHGPNGAGKSTLLEAIANLVRPIAGHIRSGPATRIAYLPQHSAIDRTFPIRVSEVVALGTWARSGALRGLATTEGARIAAALGRLSIVELADRPIASLSTGQFQRVLVARAIVQDADVFVLDEPFNAVDLKTTAALLDVLACLHADGKTIIAVVHDAEQIRRHFPNTLLLARRCIAWDETECALQASNLDAARTFADEIVATPPR